MTGVECLRHAHVRIGHASQRGEARRAAAELAQWLDFDDERAGRVALVTTELAGNLVKHVAGGGDVFLAAQRGADGGAVDVVAVDRGTGFADEHAALRDGYSTAGTPGTGLGAVMRVADAFDISSDPGAGSALAARIWRAPPGREPCVVAAGLSAMADGEHVAGDRFAICDADGATRLVVADGLGHGAGAAAAAAEAIRISSSRPELGAREVLLAMHGALRSTRGAAVAVAEIDPARRVLRYAGLGNVAGAIVGPDSVRSLVSHNGTVGHAARRVDEFTYALPADALVVLHSDGILGRWSLDRYPGLVRRSPALIAAVLLRDFRRGRDDATAVVARVR